jgi:hypothetical protein
VNEEALTHWGAVARKQTNNVPLGLKFVLLSKLKFYQIKDLDVLARDVNAATDNT